MRDRSGVPVQPLIRNQFGGSAGGKLIKDRAFYFFNYEQRIDASGVSQARQIPSDALRQGNLKFQLDDGSIQTLTPDEVKRVDPLNTGVNPHMLAVLNQYPVGNDPAYGQDGGLNFSGFRFNAPSHRNDRALVGKLDFHLDSAGKHTLNVRGTLAHNADDVILAQFPGQGPASTLRDRSGGFAAQYTAIPGQNLVNVFSLGYTRFAQANTGASGPIDMDKVGLQSVWIKDLVDIPSGPLRCLSDAAYQIDWGGITEQPVELTIPERYQSDDGGEDALFGTIRPCLLPLSRVTASAPQS